MADETLGRASVEITANLAPLGPVLDRARQIVAASMSDMQKTVEGASKAIFTALESYGVLKLAQWGTELLNVGLNAVEVGARMQETATAVGLSAEQYQIFSFAARQAGVDQDKFNQALIFFSRNVGLIAQGAVTPAAKAFNDLGAELRKNADGTINYSATLTEFLTKLGQVKESTRASADSMEAFGRGGGRMVLVAKDIAQNGFGAIEEKARAMGLVLSDETVEQSKQLEDQFRTLSTVIENDVIRGMVAAAPQIQAVIDKVTALSAEVTRFITLAPNFDSLTKEQIAMYESGLAPALEEATTKLKNLQAEQQRYTNQGLVPPRGLSDQLQAQLELVQQISSKLAQAQAAMQRIMHPDTGTAGTTGAPVVDQAQAKLEEELQRTFDKTNLSIENQTAAYARLALAAGHGVDAMRQAETANAQDAEVERVQAEFIDKNVKLTAQQIQQIRNEVAARQALKYAVDDGNKSLAEHKKSVDEEMAAVQKMIGDDDHLSAKEREVADAMGLVERALVEGNISWEQYQQAVEGATREISSANKQAQETTQKMAGEISSAVQRGASSFLDLASSTQKGVSGMQQLGNAGLGLAQDLVKVIEELFILNPLINALKAALGDTSAPLPTGSLSGIFSSWFGGGSSAADASALDLGAVDMGFIPGFASGGSFDVGGSGGVDSQLVQFNATPGEHVSVGQDSGGTRGGAGLNVVINNNHSKVKDGEITAQRSGRDLIVQIDEMIANKVRTGGATGRAIQDSFGASRVPIQR